MVSNSSTRVLIHASHHSASNNCQRLYVSDWIELHRIVLYLPFDGLTTMSLIERLVSVQGDSLYSIPSPDLPKQHKSRRTRFSECISAKKFILVNSLPFHYNRIPLKHFFQAFHSDIRFPSQIYYAHLLHPNPIRPVFYLSVCQQAGKP